jgi:hypothetical protein
VNLSQDVPDGVLAALADVSTLETLSLFFCHNLRDVSALARSVSLRELHLEAPSCAMQALQGWSASHPYPALTRFV